MNWSLAERDRRFLSLLDTVHSVNALFETLKAWMLEEGSRSCLFLRAYGKTGGETPEVADAVSAHKTRLATQVQDIVAAEARSKDAIGLAEQIIILFEGATAAAVYRGTDAVTTARNATAALIDRLRL